MHFSDTTSSALSSVAFCVLNPQSEYMPNWHIEMIAAALEDCRLGQIRRLIINVPPRSLKSHCASVAFPALLLGHNPSAQVLCVSYAQDLADKHALDTRNPDGQSYLSGVIPHPNVANEASGE